MVALGTADGARVWQWNAPPGGEYTPAGGPYGQAVLGAGVGLVAGTRAGPMVAVDVTTGAPRWSADGPERPQFTVGDGVVVREDDGNLRALDGATGATLWEAGPATRLVEGATGAVIVTAPGEVVGVWRSVRALEFADGAIRWQQQLEAPVSQAVATDAGVLVQTGWPRWEWVLFDQGNGEVRWRSEVTGALRAAPVVIGRHLVTLEDPGAGRSQVAARRLSDGVVDWGVVFDGAPASMVPRAGGGVLVGGGGPGFVGGQLTAVADGAVLWSAALPHNVVGAPAPLPGGGAVVQVVSPTRACGVTNSGSAATAPVVSG